MLSINLVLHACTKHLELDLYFVSEKVMKGDLSVQHVLFEAQLVDGLTNLVTSQTLRAIQYGRKPESK